ncbi:mersacidin/lichenicidin family type 2 lantibiotic [Amycolatopsis sp. 195334CR]|uniref:mersacidin/lichenicidin family type 2 lantibiotic n=1 Tax=Amycolatopsis sp. 195334CR TaxID=2814588 RepID=UPI001A8F8D69|nr:mersacidin/lichenicidin family type 2 lantibiotic [Amycolatopsis sp. 195334CR]MBN6033675.1 mersacidin/lichenicidin family type 2 lantibiotic [Amycolatopsis sp. 195334CR]
MNQIRAWKDPEYRDSLSTTERAALAANPAGPIRLEFSDLEAVQAGTPTTVPCFTITLSVAACGGTKAVASIGCC